MRSRCVYMVSSKVLVFAIVSGVASFTAEFGVGQEAEIPPDLFLPVEGPGYDGGSSDPVVLRTRPVLVDLGCLDSLESGKSLTFNLFEDGSFVGVFERSVVRSPESYTWFGRLEGVEGGWFSLGVHRSAVGGTIHARGKGTYELHGRRDDVVFVRQIDPSKFPPCAGALDPGEESATDPGPFDCDDRRGPVCEGCVPDDGSVIDMLAVYTPAARDGAAGGIPGSPPDDINNLINLAADSTNQAYTNSLINTTVNAVMTYEVAYTESGSAFVDLFRLTDVDDGFMDEVPLLRNAVGADVVSLIVEDAGGALGVGWLSIRGQEECPGQWDVNSFSECGYNVVKRTAADANLTFAHELGHNEGCHHDWKATEPPGAFDYSHGHIPPGPDGNVNTPDDPFKTVMAVFSSADRERYFSNPDVSFLGELTGVPVDHVCDPQQCPNQVCDPEDCSQEFPAHKALTINNTAYTVANFRIADCNRNGRMDLCDLGCTWPGCNVPGCGHSEDCNNNWFPDECEPNQDCNSNGTRDICDIGAGTSEDCTGNSIPDECEPDCNANGVADSCDILDGTSEDDNYDGIPDECDGPSRVCCLPDGSCVKTTQSCCADLGVGSALTTTRARRSPLADRSTARNAGRRSALARISMRHGPPPQGLADASSV